ncbi:MAG: peptidylprolyl isomerase [Saprospiraceae bacterium]|nr:peptidylprolyl isomerase [Saprospiraceae bacterium]
MMRDKKALDKIKNPKRKVLNGVETFADIADQKFARSRVRCSWWRFGICKEGVYVPEFEATVFSLAKDEISDIIETEFGYHFIQLIERRGNSVRAGRHVLIKPEITQRIWIKSKNCWTLFVN